MRPHACIFYYRPTWLNRTIATVSLSTTTDNRNGKMDAKTAVFPFPVVNLCRSQLGTQFMSSPWSITQYSKIAVGISILSACYSTKILAFPVSAAILLFPDVCKIVTALRCSDFEMVRHIEKYQNTIKWSCKYKIHRNCTGSRIETH